ncbi:polyprenyl synthetase family protein [Streptomyces spectabilis]|uniref:Geranylgeranyl diphosphate synthase type I n=1 Tax=Streptomyces spectabilis TaxID=68270 RepID=A0A7W8EZL8_STRST|nr:polyprenyl synthetase family protein [Streptomyces spectabilis]MBB5110036.1 geranylgeranyl diphosphate synthase type I [Streptomyces spectabilis]
MAGTDSVLGAPLDLAGICGEVDARLAAFLDGKARAAAGQRLPGEIVEVLSGFLFAGGKRIRPLLCVIGWNVACGKGPAGPVVRAAASLEMFHAFALIHDDLVDESDTRRGQPTAHRALAARHAGRADAGWLGVSTAILLGDLALVWSDELVNTAGLTTRQLADAVAVIDAMRTEVVYGQYLDLLATDKPTTDTGRAMTIARYKTAKYTVERPLHLGAAFAGAAPSLRAALSDFALPVGEAFQLRDDLLGTFGTSGVTGKPCLDDLRGGTNTALVTLAMQRADPAQQRTLCSLIGNPELDEDDADRVRLILDATDAHRAVEQLIHSRHEQACRALARGSVPTRDHHRPAGDRPSRNREDLLRPSAALPNAERN